MKKETDLTYIQDGIFTRFFPNTKEGEKIYNEMATQLNTNNVAIFNNHLESTLQQIRQAGYTVSVAVKPIGSIEDILNEFDL